MKNRRLVKFSAVTAVAVCIALTSLIGANAVVVEDNAVSAIEIQENDNMISAASATDIPSRYSSVDAGYVTPVLSQTYNDCWGFAGLASYESKLLRSGVTVSNMSTDMLNLWATPRRNKTGWQRTINDMGYYEITTGYLTSWQGGVEADKAGSIDLSGETNGDDLPTDLAQYGVTAIQFLDNTNRDEIKTAIMNDGGAYAAFASSISCYSDSRISYFMPPSYSGGSIGHAIELVGWNDNYSKTNFKAIDGVTPKNNGAWLCKGSWGSDFNSRGGYFWISYEDGFLLGDIYNTCYSIKDFERITDDVRLEQNEIYGATYNFDYVDENSIVYINKFDFSNGYNSLDKVIFETSSLGADYSIYYIPCHEITRVPSDDRNSWTKLYDGVVGYNGYICADIEDFDLPLSFGAIGVEINTSSVNKGISENSADYIRNTLGIDEWLSSTEKSIFVSNAKRDDSYIYYGGSMKELLDWYKTNNDDEIGGTFVIKAVTRGDGPSVTIPGDVDLNGIVNVSDATLTQRFIVESENPTDVKKLNADINGDGILDISDVTEIQWIVVSS